MRRLLPFSAFAAVAVAVAVGGCAPFGSGDADPAQIAPVTAPVVVDAAIDPEGEQETALRELLAKFPGGERAADGTLVGAAIEDALSSAGAPIDFAEDIEPWLGASAGIVVTGAQSGGEPDVAIVLSSDDAGQAEDALAQAFESARQASHEGVEYRVAPAGRDEVAGGIVEEFVVVGTPAAFTATVDASKGESLADSDAYDEAIGELPDERLASFYADPQQLVELGGRAGGLGDAGFAAQQAAAGAGPVAGSVVADGEGVTIEATTTVPAGMPTPAAGAGDVLAELPAGSALALAVDELGATLRGSIEQAATGSGTDTETLGALVQSQTGIDAVGALDWLGDAGLFLGGASPGALEAGAVLETTDPEASARALDGLARLLRRAGGVEVGGAGGGSEAGFTLEAKDLPEPIVVAQRGDRIGIGYGRAGVDATFDQGDPLSGDPVYTAAVAALGSDYDPSFYASVDPLMELAGRAGGLGRDPSFAAAQAYLDPVASLISGGRVEGDRAWSRLRLNVE